MFVGGDNAHIPLCRSYCVETYKKCRYSLLKIFKLQPWRDGLVSRTPETEEELARDAVAFCEKYASEAPYCYPQIMALESQHTSPRPRAPTDCVCAVPVATRLDQPRAIADPGDKSNRLFILEESGFVKILDRGTNKVLEQPLLNMTRVLPGEPDFREGIAGAMNFILHPNFICNRLLYVFYIHAINVTDDDLGLYSVNIFEFEVSETDPNTVNYDSERLIFSYLYEKVVPEFLLHGSGLYFKDGYLHISIGSTPGSEDAFNL